MIPGPRTPDPRPPLGKHAFVAALAGAVLLGTAFGAPAALNALTDAGGGGADAPLGFRLSKTGATGSEVNVGVTSNGNVFFGGWNHIARSTDDGLTWSALQNQRVGPVAVGFAADRVLIVDKDTDRVLVDDTDLGCTVLTWSDDYGKTWNINPAACGGGVTDHQKIAVGKRTAVQDPTGQLYENVIYVCANGLSHTSCAASFDGGRTFGPGMPSGTINAKDPSDFSLTCAMQGVPVAGPTGILYQPRTACVPEIWWSEDNGFTWEHSIVYSGSGDSNGDAADVAVTPDGTVYFFWTKADHRPYLARSTDGGRTWTAPYAVAPPEIKSAVFPVIVAGDDGRIGLAFYGATDNPSGWDGNPGKAPDSVRWHLYADVVVDADAGAPTFNPVRLTSDADPLQYGCLSKMGGCLRNIADYMDVDVGPDGRIYVAYVDGCPPGCASKAASGEDDGFVAVQISGPTLRK